MKLKEVCQLFNVTYDTNEELDGISIDSRTIKPGQLFIAIRGEKFDGHDFVADVAASNLASAIIVEKKIPNINTLQIVVSNSMQALTTLAKFHRNKMQCKIIALTGSNGKTTVKEMISSILPLPSFASPGNFNNHIGVPLSVLQLQAQHRYAVFELGANHIGEISQTVGIVRPQVALINNIDPAHIGEFGSMDNIAQAKGEIFQGLNDHGIAVINDDSYHPWDSQLTNKTVITFSRQKKAQIYATDISVQQNGATSFSLVTPLEKVKVHLNVPGEHNVSNALAAAACTLALGIPIETIAIGLSTFRGVNGRMTVCTGKNNSVIIDDTYNANLRSSLAALEVLAKYRGRRIFVFGDMGELGKWSQEHHAAVGKAAKDYGIDTLITYGKYSMAAADAFGTGKHFESQEGLVADLLKYLDENTTVLVKGSRSSKMEKIVYQLVSEVH